MVWPNRDKGVHYPLALIRDHGVVESYPQGTANTFALFMENWGSRKATLRQTPKIILP